MDLIHSTHQKSLEQNPVTIKKIFNFLQNNNSNSGEFKANVNSIYQEMVRYESPIIKQVLDINLASCRNLTKEQSDYLSKCVENPKSLLRKKNFLQKIKKSLRKRINNFY